MEKKAIGCSITLVGSARDIHNRVRRRQHRQVEHTARLGESIVVRPHQRVDIRLTALEPHLPALAVLMEKGIVSAMVGSQEYSFEEVQAALLGTETPTRPPLPRASEQAPEQHPEPSNEALAETSDEAMPEELPAAHDADATEEPKPDEASDNDPAPRRARRGKKS
jgi:hypothetical protein